MKKHISRAGKALKHTFIPHEHNDYKPHFFRELSVAIVVIGSIFLLGFSVGSSFLIHKTVLGANVTASVLVDLTNESRLAYNQEPLARNSVLDQAANLKAEDMATNGYFSHNSPTGITPWHWFKQAGYAFLYAGENLAINFTDATEVRNAWLASPTHRANLLDVKFREIGMATVSGVYKDGPTIYVVQLFGTPAKVKVEETSPSNQEPVQEPVVVVVPDTPSSAPQTSQEPQIKGDTVKTDMPEAPKEEAQAELEEYKPLFTSEELAVVQNVYAEELPQTAESVTYSKWYERALFGGSYYVSLFYKVLLAFIVIALLTMILIEIRKQHWKHITYGLAMLLVVTICIIINQAFW